MEDTTDNARNQAVAQMRGIKEMVAALTVDYDRLEELRDARDDEDTPMDDADREELAELEAAAGDCESEDDAHERIQEDPLSVEVRSDWRPAGDNDNSPVEFKILLCTGGPAVQIRGELDTYNTPCHAWLEYQDWGTPWTEYRGDEFDYDALLTYCREFYFGD